MVGLTSTIIFRVADALIWVLAAELASLLYFGRLIDDSNGQAYQILEYLFPFMNWLASSVSGQYRLNWQKVSILVICSRMLIACILTAGCAVIFIFAIHQTDNLSRIWFGSVFLLALLISCSMRALVLVKLNTSLYRGEVNGLKSRKVAILGSGKFAATLIQRVMNNPQTGYRIEAVMCDPTDPDIQVMSNLNVLQTLEQLETFINERLIREVWIIPNAEQPYAWAAAIARLENTAATLRWFPLIPDYLTQKFAMCAEAPSFEINAAVIDSDGMLHKIIFDRLFSLMALLVFSPLLLLIAIAIKLSSPGPVLYRSIRHGIGGKKFSCLKFRTMKLHQEKEGEIIQATANDARVTKIGRFLRRTSLDELPQFFNVLMGDMSVVGPRPHAVEQLEYFKNETMTYMSRHKVKPGITGWAQINGFRGETETAEKMQKRIEFDIYYIRNWSFWLDIKIIFWTAFRGWTGNNVY